MLFSYSSLFFLFGFLGVLFCGLRLLLDLSFQHPPEREIADREGDIIAHCNNQQGEPR